jgi:RNA polymerase sigma-70 factor (ECF subfamily)
VCPPEPSDFDRLYNEHVDFVWRSVRRLGVPESALADAVQDVFVVVHRRLADFDGRAALRHWLLGICVHVARREFRTRRRRQPESFAKEPLEPDALADSLRRSPLEEVERDRAVRLLYELLTKLDAPKREVLVLAEFEQLTGPEMAAILNISVNTVSSRLRVARLEFERAVARAAAVHRRRP